MGCLQKCLIFCQTTQNLILVLLIFLILSSYSSSIHMTFLAEGRMMPNKVEASKKPIVRVEKTVKMRYLIGSFPPRCDKMRCVSCGHCEAVQVPIFPSIKHNNLKVDDTHQLQFYGTTPTIAYSRGDGISNYKPMCWKCKCGNYIFNP
ncbi:hypothetical protein Leryth_005401 [Lithospermum erythrorhizon]|uniref:Epidermal patterning factor-like protein n=1 Tax=Lithospermum erythrorhizon TaxID=34254 RepID=A0AAV3NXN7_LITER|nr:hypothetical protein Leryth_005401 [Lithospermum erythrorhizon]